ncbi:hypothetical protein BV20DRAFT_1056562 [Pilatotrama ljubarskyi]|nr:hypothetical protein BV20DRAFT_1056562 [Pilatotrama ljubarskyi]
MSHNLQTDITKSLSALFHLSVLQIHLDFDGTPHPLTKWMAHRDPFAVFKAHEEHLQDAAHVIAQHVAPSVEFICLLFCRNWENEWLPFWVVCGKQGSVQVVREKDVTSLGKMSLMDDLGPCTKDQIPYPGNIRYFEF